MDEDGYEVVVEESEIDLVGIIPAHLKEFDELTINGISTTEISLTIDGNQLKGRIGDSLGTNLFFHCDEDTETAQLIACADKMVKLEHVFMVPKEEFSKPFIPTDALKQPE